MPLLLVNDDGGKCEENYNCISSGGLLFTVWYGVAI